VIRIVLAEDQTMMLGALAALLSLEVDLEIVGRAANGREALEQVKQLDPDIVLTDIEMPGLTGLELAGEIRSRKLRPRVIILTTFARTGYLRRALDAGVMGYLMKDAPSESLAIAIRKVHGGGRVIDPSLAVDAWAESDPLTDRERQVLRLAGEGMNSADIAREVCLSEGTVRNYLSQSMSKLNASSRIEAARLARDKGWL
jgi:two-component system response regulator DesR